MFDREVEGDDEGADIGSDMGRRAAGDDVVRRCTMEPYQTREGREACKGKGGGDKGKQKQNENMRCGGAASIRSKRTSHKLS